MRRILFATFVPLALAACGETSDTAVEEAAAAETSASLDAAGEVSGEIASEASNEAGVTEAPKATEVAASASQARCEITAVVPGTQYKGPCKFEALGGASFVVSTDRPAGFVDGHSEMILEADTSTAAGMSVRTSDGELVYVGTAARDGACWINDSYDVCAYAE